jgi:outer membrane protein TolC
MYRYYIRQLMVVVTFFVAITTSFAQNVTLDQLIRAALEYHPGVHKMAMEQDVEKVKMDAIRSTYWPDISLHAQAGYQSLVPEFPLKVPGVVSPNIPKDRYQASIDINQIVYDGGVTRKMHDILQIESQLAQTRIMAERFPIQQQVVDAWFGLAFISIKRSILRLTLEDVEARVKMLQVGLKGGIVMQMDVDRLAAELYRVRQKDAEIHADSTRLVEVLSEITGITFTPQTVFEVTAPEEPNVYTQKMRPEERLLDLATELSDARLQLGTLSRRPKVAGFAQGAYGKPGLDIFSDTFSPFWQAGVKASWTLWDKGNSRRDLEINRIIKNQIEDDRELFNRGIRLAIRHQEAEIEKNKDLLSSDEEIIAIHERIKLAAEAKLDEGIINATDYLLDVRAVEQARLTYEIRKIAIRQAEANINIIRGGL